MPKEESPPPEAPKAKRRGRKRERDDVYFDVGYKKIAEIKAKLAKAKETGMAVTERQRLRNQISAQKSRLKKKEEVMFLNKKVREKDMLFQKFIQVTLKNLSQEQSQ